MKLKRRGLIAAHLGLGELSEELADQVEDAGVRRRVGTWRIADRVLIDANDLVDVLQAENVVVGSRRGAGTVQFAGEGVVENLVDERAFARAADAGHRDEGAEREADVDVLEVVLAGAFDREPGPDPSPTSPSPLWGEGWGEG